MKKLSLQWRITIMTVLLIGIACVSMELLLCSSGIHYMDSIGESLQDLTPEGETDFFDPDLWSSGKLLYNQLVYYCYRDRTERNSGLLCQWTCLKALTQLFCAGRKGTDQQSYRHENERKASAGVLPAESFF